MQISFFEEFPTDESLSKLLLLPFRTNLYIAAHSVQEFLGLQKNIKITYPLVDQVIYWPILDIREGYWMSAFAKNDGLNRIIKEITNAKEEFAVLWDAELPLVQKSLYFTEISHVMQNRKLIQAFIHNKLNKHLVIVTAFPKYKLQNLFSSLTLAAFSQGDFQYIDMLYTSLLKINNTQQYLRTRIRDVKRNFAAYAVGLGLIGRGVEDHTTPLLSVGELNNDLQLAKEEDIQEVILYRLGGLTEEYTETLQKYK